MKCPFLSLFSMWGASAGTLSAPNGPIYLEWVALKISGPQPTFMFIYQHVYFYY